MYEEIRKAAIFATLNIFETMFFTFLEPLEGNGSLEEVVTEEEKEFDLLPESQSPGLLKSEIHFTGLYSGFLRLFIPYDLSKVLTMNFMGFEEEVTESQIADMAGELTNMVCGNLFSSLDKTSVYTLSSPSTQRISLQDKIKPAGSEEIFLDFLTEGQQISISIQFEKPNEDHRN
jgi:CheY-specific phosphatase CheX